MHQYAPLYLIPLLLLMFWHVRRRRLREDAATTIWQDAQAGGLTEPPTLHPIINQNLCFGSSACVKACPEEALGIVNGKAFLVNPSVCIGHAACAAACPMGAISLVFGTATRGVEIPYVSPEFETNVPGLFIAGELGGMGLIRKAVDQGRRAVANIEKKLKSAPSPGNHDYDLVIIGAGPAGISASLAAEESKLRYVTLEQEHSIGGTTAHYPRGKIVMTAPMALPIIGKVKAYEISKESLMELWQGVLDQVKPPIRFGERMEELTRDGDLFVARSSGGSYRSRSVLLAIGRRGTPRTLGVAGEQLPKVVYRLIEAEQYRGQAVLVVGGGDSALEAAIAVSQQAGTTVTLSYRGPAFNRVKAKNRQQLDELSAAGRLDVLMQSDISLIEPDKVTITYEGQEQTRPNDIVIICAGGELPTPMLKRLGIDVHAHYGE